MFQASPSHTVCERGGKKRNRRLQPQPARATSPRHHANTIMNCDLPLTKATVALGSTDGQFAFLVRELVFPPGKSAAEIREMFVNDLAAAKTDTAIEQVAVGLPHPKDKKFRYSMKLVGQVRRAAIPRFAQLHCEKLTQKKFRAAREIMAP